MAYRLEHQPPIGNIPEIYGTIYPLSPSDISFHATICPIAPSETLPIYDQDKSTLQQIFISADALMAKQTELTGSDFTRVVSPKEANITHRASIDAVKALLMQDPNTVCVPLLFGAANLSAELMASLPSNISTYDRILPFVVKRSNGMELSQAQVFVARNAYEQIARASRVIIFDDILDKGGALATTAKIIAKIRGLELSHSDLSIAKQLDSDNADKQKTFIQLGLLVSAADIIYIAPYSKNAGLSEVLSVASYHQAPHPYVHKHLEELILLSANDWVMGDHGIDTGIPWATIQRYLLQKDPYLMTHPKVTSLYAPLNRALIRAGQSIDGLIAFSPRTPTEAPFDSLTKQYSLFVAKALQRKFIEDSIL